jgi:hypothetical protein
MFVIISVIIETASSKTFLICWAINPYTTDEPRVFSSIYSFAENTQKLNYDLDYHPYQ